VVDATGRGGRTASWLPAMGYVPPQEEQLQVNVKYVTQRLRLATGALGRQTLMVIGAKPGRPTGMSLLADENGGWLLH